MEPPPFPNPSSAPDARTSKFDLRALYETSQLLGTSLDLDFVLRNLLLTAMSKLLVTRATALLYDEETQTYRPAITKGLPALADRDTLTLDDGPVTTLRRDEAVPPVLREYGLTLVLPLLFDNRPLGLVGLGPKGTQQPFRSEELEFVQSLVNMSAAAVRNALMVRRLRETNRDLDARVRELDTLFDLSQEFNATRDRQHLIKLFSFALMGQMTVNRHLLLLERPASDDEEKHFETVAARGLKELPSALHDRLRALDQPVLVREAENNWPELAERDVALALPIRHQGQTRAVLCLGSKLTGSPYRPGDLTFLQSLGNLAFVALRNTYLVEDRIEKERLEEETRQARAIQKRLLPHTTPDVPGLDVATCSYPSRLVGGDYFDVIELDEEHTLFAVADVTGKGVPASLLMAHLQACLHTLVPMELAPAESTQHINRVITQNTAADKFITFFQGRYDAESRAFSYTNAGHNPPLLLRQDGTVEDLDTGGLLLGVMASASYEQEAVALHPGDVLVCFTDGVVEAMNEQDEEYTRARLEEIVRAHRSKSAQDVLDAVLHDVGVFAGHPDFFADDLTMIVLKGT